MSAVDFQAHWRFGTGGRLRQNPSSVWRWLRAEPLPFLHASEVCLPAGCARRHGIQNVIGGDPFGFRFKVEDQAVPPGRCSSFDIFKLTLNTFAELDLGRHNQSLPAWAAAKSKVLLLMGLRSFVDGLLHMTYRITFTCSGREFVAPVAGIDRFPFQPLHLFELGRPPITSFIARRGKTQHQLSALSWASGRG